MRNLFVTRPQVRVTFYPQSFVSLGKPISLTITDTAEGGVNKADDLISVQTQKDISQPAGHFTVVLAPKPLIDGFIYQDILRPGDLVVIEMGPDRDQPNSSYQQIVDGQGYSGLEPVMIGSIDDVREVTQFNSTSGAPERSITVVGRDFGKYLVDDQVWWDSWSEPQRALNGFAPEVDEWLRAGKEKGGKPAGLVQLFLAWLQTHFDVPFTFKGQKRTYKLFGDMLRYSLTTEAPSVAAPLNLLSYQGAPWALMERAACPPLYVLSIDTRRRMDTNILLDPTGGARIDNNNKLYFNTKLGNWDSQPSLLLYRNPWANRQYDDWAKLPTRVVEDVDLIARDIGRGNEEISNTWRVWADSQGVFRTQGGGDMADARKLRDYESVQRYGERPLILQTAYISGFGDGDQKEIVKRFSFMLKDWNRWNEWYLNGKFVMKGMASIKAGDRLWHWDRDFGHYTDSGFSGGADYYVESVSQEFSCFTRWTTTVGVTRGQRHRVTNSKLDFDDVSLTLADLDNLEAANRKKLRTQAKQVSLWGQD